MSSWELSQGYLEAILDAGGPTVDASRRRSGDDQELEKENVKSAAINYFMSQMAIFDDTDLHRAWRKVATYKQQHQRGSRLENMSWRIWQILRRRKILEMIESERAAKERIDREEGRKDASEDLSMSEDLTSEDGDKDSSVTQSTSDGQLDEMWSDEKKSTGVYVVMISMHGLVRGNQMELGRDSDTGGQVKYVVELARALAMLPEVYRVDLLTRQILSPEVDSSYGEPLEPLLQTDEGSLRGAFIVRVPCGPSDKYMRKELLWPHIQEFADGSLAHIVSMSQLLGDQIADGRRVWPCVIHGHYADAGDAAALLSGALNVPMVVTGHSLGRNKMEQLRKRQSFDEIAATYKIARRIEAEETSLDAADFVITSTKEEVSNQWSHYDGYDMKIAQGIYSRKRKHLSCSGRFVPVMAVIPPGLDLAAVPEQDYLEGEPDTPSSGEMSVPSSPRVVASPRADPVIWTEINRFLANPAKPMVLALARPDPKKNLTTLLKAYGEDKQLRELANLTLIMGNRDSIDAMATGNANTMTNVLKLIDKYDLYGQVAYPKHHLQSDVPDIYRLAARTKGVFVNPALVEPFGLTLIEAAAHGLPIVATKNGGPVDIVKTLQNGILVDPHDSKAIAEALRGLVADHQKWAECRRNGLKNINCYRWSEHCKTYLKYVRRCLKDRLPHGVDGEVDTGFYADEVAGALEQSLTRAFRTLQMVESLTEDDFDKILKMVKMEAAARANGNEESEELVRNFSCSPDFYASLMSQEDVNGAGTKPVEGKNGMQMADRETDRNKKSVEENIRQAGAVIEKRKKLVVIAVDDYTEAGEPSPAFGAHVRQVLEVLSSKAAARGVGFALATAMSAQELIKALSPISLRAFDVVITGSGSKLYYPRPRAPNGARPKGVDGESVWLCPDNVYEDQIGYRWGGNAIRSTMVRLAEREGYLLYDEGSSNTKLIAFKVADPEKAKISEDLLAYVRRRGLRANFTYCKGGTALHVLPLHASRAKALRYLFVKWGINVANMVIVAGPQGDLDYKKLLRGAQKNIVVGEAAEKEGPMSRLLHAHPWIAEGDDTAGPAVTKVELSVESLRQAFQNVSVL